MNFLWKYMLPMHLQTILGHLLTGAAMYTYHVWPCVTRLCCYCQLQKCLGEMFTYIFLYTYVYWLLTTILLYVPYSSCLWCRHHRVLWHHACRAIGLLTLPIVPVVPFPSTTPLTGALQTHGKVDQLPILYCHLPVHPPRSHTIESWYSHRHTFHHSRQTAFKTIKSSSHHVSYV